MTASTKLTVIKSVHTVIWVFFNAVLGYMYYAVFTKNTGTLFWICLGFIIAECLVLVAFKWSCPLTYLARRYSDSQLENFDIYLPLWLAKYNKEIYAVIFGVLLVAYLFYT